MVYSEDITTFDQYIQRIRLYQFLTGIHEDLDKENRDLLLIEPLLTVDQAYATIWREITRQDIMTGGSSFGIKSSEIGMGLAINKRSIPQRREEDDRRKLRCSHCGGTCHTKEGCFKLHGYPEWWDDL